MFDRIVKVLVILFMVDDDTPDGKRRWQLFVSLFILMFSFHILWACGYLKVLGIGGGFAQTTDMTDIKTQLSLAANSTTDIRVRLLKHSIIEARIQQCNATTKLYFTNRLNELLDEYYVLTKIVLVVPACDDLK
jgi:hypothetical protein